MITRRDVLKGLTIIGGTVLAENVGAVDLVDRVVMWGGGLPKAGLIFSSKGVLSGSTVMVDTSGNSNDITVFGYCPTFDGSADQYIAGTQILGNETITAHGGTAETLTVAAGKVTPSAGTVEWFQFADGRKYILQSSKTANQVYFWNVTSGHIADYVTITGVTAPCCTSKASTPFLHNGYTLRENIIGTTGFIAHSSEPNVGTQLRGSGNITAQAGSGLFAAFAGEVLFGDNSVLRYLQTEITTGTDKIYYSFYVAMDDGLAPTWGASNNASVAMTIVVRGLTITDNATLTAIGGGVYGILCWVDGVGTGATKGSVYKYTTNDARAFKVTRFHCYINPLADYHFSYFTNIPSIYNTGTRESFIPANTKIYNSTCKIVCIGDSLTAADYPLTMQVIYPDATIVDAGTAGDTVAGMLARFQADVLDQNPDYICYFSAINSILGSVSAAAILADIDSMISMSAAAGVPIVIGTCLPFGASASWTEALQIVLEAVNTGILARANAAGVLAAIDLYTPLLATGSETNMVASAVQADGLHLTDAGDTLVARLFADALNISASTPTGNILSPTLGAGLIALNAPAGLESADDSDTWFTDSTANDVDPTTLDLNENDKIFKGSKALAFYSTALTGSKISKAEKYVD